MVPGSRAHASGDVAFSVPHRGQRSRLGDCLACTIWPPPLANSHSGDRIMAKKKKNREQSKRCSKRGGVKQRKRDAIDDVQQHEYMKRLQVTNSTSLGISRLELAMSKHL